MEAMLRRKIKCITFIADRSVRHLVKSVYIHEAGFRHVVDCSTISGIRAELASARQMGLPAVVFMGAQEQSQCPLVSIDKILSQQPLGDSRFFIFGTDEGNVTLAMELAQRGLGTVLNAPFSQKDFAGAIWANIENIRLPATAANILVVDDHNDGAMSLKRSLNGEGFQNIRTAHSLDEAMTQLHLGLGRLEQIDLIISEISLGEQSGVSLLKRIRNDHNWGRELPFILYSRTFNAEIIKEAQQLNVSELIVKPVHGEVLTSKIAALLPHRDQNDVQEDDK